MIAGLPDDDCQIARLPDCQIATIFMHTRMHMPDFHTRLRQKNKIIKYKKHLTWPIKYIKHYKIYWYMKSTPLLSINMLGNGKQKTWQKNTIFTSKMLKELSPC